MDKWKCEERSDEKERREKYFSQQNKVCLQLAISDRNNFYYNIKNVVLCIWHGLQETT